MLYGYIDGEKFCRAEGVVRCLSAWLLTDRHWEQWDPPRPFLTPSSFGRQQQPALQHLVLGSRTASAFCTHLHPAGHLCPQNRAVVCLKPNLQLQGKKESWSWQCSQRKIVKRTVLICGTVPGTCPLLTLLNKLAIASLLLYYQAPDRAICVAMQPAHLWVQRCLHKQQKALHKLWWVLLLWWVLSFH